MRKNTIVHCDKNAPLKSSPINPAWILEGRPVARNVVLSTSDDTTACTILWDCTAGKFNWHYDFDETVHIVEGSVVVRSEGSPPKPATGVSKRGSPDPKVREAWLRDFSRGIFHNPPPADIAEAVLHSALQAPARVANQLLAQPYPRTYWRDIVARQSVPVLYAIRPRLRDQGEALLSRRGAMAQMEVFEEAGHSLFVDEATRFNALTSSFARRAFTSRPDAAQSASSAHLPSSGN